MVLPVGNFIHYSLRKMNLIMTTRKIICILKTVNCFEFSQFRDIQSKIISLRSNLILFNIYVIFYYKISNIRVYK